MYDFIDAIMADMVRISIIAAGSRGDVQPYLALGAGLSARGHTVRLAASPRYEPLAREAGLDFFSLANSDPLRIKGTQAERASASRSYTSLVRSMRRATADSASERYANGLEACKDAHLILTSPLAFMMAYSIGEKIDVPVIRAFYSPASPTREYPALIGPRLPGMPRLFRLWTHHLVSRLVLLRFRAQVDNARRHALGLGPISPDPLRVLDERRVPVLHGYSSIVLPPPPDWGNWIHVTGYWYLRADSQWQPAPDLVRFLRAGPPPIYVGFGSMADEQPEQLANLVVQALARAGYRGVLATGWGGLSRVAAPHVHVVDEVPHEWLFPRVSAVVHHGGAGTTGAGLRAGRPTVVVPFGMPDQRFWGRRIAEIGAGPQPIRRKHLTVERLAAAIRATSNPAMRERAADIGRRLKSEDGVARAADVIDAYVSTPSFGRRL
jgi:UDP:flavonoid glycosyltransferase YjiC (YdhE family)